MVHRDLERIERGSSVNQLQVWVCGDRRDRRWGNGLSKVDLARCKPVHTLCLFGNCLEDNGVNIGNLIFVPIVSVLLNFNAIANDPLHKLEGAGADHRASAAGGSSDLRDIGLGVVGLTKHQRRWRLDGKDLKRLGQKEVRACPAQLDCDREVVNLRCGLKVAIGAVAAKDVANVVGVISELSWQPDVALIVEHNCIRIEVGAVVELDAAAQLERIGEAIGAHLIALCKHWNNL